MASPKLTKADLKRFIGKNDIETVFELLFDNNLETNDIISLRAQYNYNEGERLKGTIPEEEYLKTRSRVINGLLNIIDNLSDADFDRTIPPPSSKEEKATKKKPTRSTKEAEPVQGEFDEFDEEEFEVEDRSIKEDYTDAGPSVEPSPEVPVQETTYSSGRDDQGFAHSDSNQETYARISGDNDRGTDQLDIKYDVEAFANLISSKDLTPPLSIGLFGDWGSGKSFFMNSLNNAVKENVEWVKKEVDEKVNTFYSELEKTEEEQALTEKVTQVLPDTKNQINQIEEWVKHQDSWAYASLLKIYGDNQDKVDQLIRDMVQNPELAKSKLKEEIDTRKQAQAKKLTADYLDDSDNTRAYIKKLAKTKESQKHCRNISQIKFNAWHYIDTNLWASLITNIFEELNSYIGNLPDEEKQQIELYRTLSNTREQMKDTQKEIQEVEKEKRKIEEEIEQLETAKKEEIRTLKSVNFSTIWNVLKDKEYIKSTETQLKTLLINARQELNIDVVKELKIEAAYQTLKTEVDQVNEGISATAEMSELKAWNAQVSSIQEKSKALLFIDEDLDNHINILPKLLGEEMKFLTLSSFDPILKKHSKVINNLVDKDEDYKAADKEKLEMAQEELGEQLIKIQELNGQLHPVSEKKKSSLIKIGRHLSQSLESIDKFAESGDLISLDTSPLIKLSVNLEQLTKNIDSVLKSTLERGSQLKDIQKELEEVTNDTKKVIEGIQKNENITETLKSGLTKASTRLDELIEISKDKENNQNDLFKRINLDVKENWAQIISLFDSYNNTRGQVLTAVRDFKSMSTKKKWIYGLIVFTIIAAWGAAQLFSNFNPESASAESIKDLSALAAGLFSILKVIPSFIKRAENALGKINTAVGLLDKAKMQLTELESRASQELQSQIEDSLEVLRQKEETIAALEERKANLNQQLGNLEEEKDAIEHGKRFSAFIEKRLESADYQKHLGLISIIRNDLEKLTTYLHNRGQHSKVISQLFDSSEEQQHDTNNPYQLEQVDTIDRIILYIDDLDRCPPQKVAEVLQAIHLILAFPLFVVVVGVDIRWVSKSLLEKYGKMLSFTKEMDEGSHSISDDWSATPFDYLEKIFQIPFRLQKMTDFYRKKYITSLLEDDIIMEEEPVIAFNPNIELPEPNEGNQQGNITEENIELVLEPQKTPQEQTNTEEEQLSEDTSEVSQRSFAKASLSNRELEFIQTVTPILGGSPRTIKRFVNICRLIKSHDIWGEEGHLDKSGLDRYERLIFLLAFIVGLPGLGEVFLKWVAESRGQDADTDQDINLEEFVKSITDDQVEAALKKEWEIFRQFIIKKPEENPKPPSNKEEDREYYPSHNFIPEIRKIELKSLKKLGPVVARYSFRFTSY